MPAWRVPVVTLSVTLVRLLPKEAQAEARMASDRALHRLFGFVLLGPKCLGPCPHGLPSPIPYSPSPVPYHNQVSFVYLFVCVCVCVSVRIPFQVSFVYASDVALLNYASVSDSPQSTLHPLRTHFLLPAPSATPLFPFDPPSQSVSPNSHLLSPLIRAINRFAIEMSLKVFAI